MKKLSLLSLFMPLLSTVYAQEPIPFTADRWDLFGGQTEVIGGRQAYTGLALLKEVQLKNGTIEWDTWVTGGRSYAGVVFHQQPTRDYEEFYVRPHKGNGLNADAFQYSPVFHGVSCWQLFHGEGYTRAAVIPVNKWVHFRLDILGNRARITMEGEPSTELIVNHLELGEISGRIGVKGPADGSAWFSNFTYNTATPELPTAPMEESPSPGIIQDWEITQPMVNSKIDPNQYYSALGDLQWMPVEAGPSGLVVLDREVARNPVQPGWLFARTTFRSGEPRNHLFHLGYSDFITVFINGTAVFNSTNAYQSRDPGFQGLIGFFDGLLLPLKKGENEITLLIGEQFGGWGFMMRDGEALNIDAALTKKWELRNKLNYPESVVYDPAAEMLYVSNYLEGSQEYISQVSLDGTIINREWITGLTRPTGLCLSNGKLYAAERTGIVVIDPVKGQIIKRITLNDCGFPNDISATKDGTLYVSDGMKNRIYEVTKDQASILLESMELKNINGLHIDGNRLLAGCSGDASLKSIDLKTKQVTLLAKLYPGAILDGLQTIEDGRILFSDFNGHLFILDKPGTCREVLNTTTIQSNLADFVWIPEKQLLVIPGLDSNTLTCWKVSGLK